MIREKKFKAWDNNLKVMHDEFVIVDGEHCIKNKGTGCPINAGLRDTDHKLRNKQKKAILNGRTTHC